MSGADKLLLHLHRVKRTGPGKWIACCPAHDDKSPSLSIRELDDGRVLLHDFGGCSADDVLGAIGMTMVDVFPPRDPTPGAGRAPVRRPWVAADLIYLAAHEATICVLVTADMIAGRQADRPRLIEAARRLGNIAEAVDAR